MLPAGSVSSKEHLDGIGTYECEIKPQNTPGYNTSREEGASLKVTIKITKEQTPEGNSLDIIADTSIVYDFVTQKPLNK